MATAEAVLIRIADPRGDGADAAAGDPVTHADAPRYDDGTLADIAATYDAELDRLGDGPPPTPDPADVDVGDDLPALVRGPLTVGDMVAWQAGATPTYGAGPFNYRRARWAPHTAIVNGRTGWPHAAAQRHDDPWLAHQHGIPLPFANGDMMTAWAATLVTHWSGRDGRLLAQEATLEASFLYGDVLRLDGTVVAVESVDGRSTIAGGWTAATIEWEAVNQRDETSFRGESVVGLPG